MADTQTAPDLPGHAPFTIPGPFTDQTPFESMHFWQWALTQPRDAVGITNYLQSLGFVVGQHKITPAEYDTLRYAVDTFHRHAPRMPARPFAELFTAAGPEHPGFYVQGRPGRWMPCPELVRALIDAGWIYDVEPGTTYFEVIGGDRLFAKYQQIIGSRFLCGVME